MSKSIHITCKVCKNRNRLLIIRRDNKKYARCKFCLSESKVKHKKPLILILLFLVLLSLPSNASNYFNISFVDEQTLEPINTGYNLYNSENLTDYSYGELAKVEYGEGYYIYGCENNKDYYSNRILAFNTYKENSTKNKVYDCRKKGFITSTENNKINKVGNISLTLSSNGYIRKADFCVKSSYINLTVNYPPKEIPSRLKGKVDSCYWLYYSFQDSNYTINLEVNERKGFIHSLKEYPELKIYLIDNELDYFNNYFNELSNGTDVGIEDYEVNLKVEDLYPKKSIYLYIRMILKKIAHKL